MTPYTGEGGGNKQNMFSKDTQVGWKKVFGDTQLNLQGGQLQYEYMEFVLEKTDGQGRKCLETQLMLWNWRLEAHENPNLANAILRENDRSLWRTYYEEKAVFTMRKVQLLQPGPPPIRPDDVLEMEVPVMEPPDLEDFYAAT